MLSAQEHAVLAILGAAINVRTGTAFWSRNKLAARAHVRKDAASSALRSGQQLHLIKDTGRRHGVPSRTRQSVIEWAWVDPTGSTASARVDPDESNSGPQTVRLLDPTGSVTPLGLTPVSDQMITDQDRAKGEPQGEPKALPSWPPAPSSRSVESAPARAEDLTATSGQAASSCEPAGREQGRRRKRHTYVGWKEARQAAAQESENGAL